MGGVPGYRILGQIAAGASGTVYRAVQERLSREVALKVLTGSLHGGAEARARFVREARLHSRLSHPNVLTLLDAGFVDGRPFLVTELVDGGTMRELLAARGRLPAAEVLRIGAGVAAGLAHAHAMGIVHRDLKPENVLLATDRRVLVCDFGLAKGGTEQSQILATAADVIQGTPGYLAPEVVSGAEAGPAADLYALGVMLHEALAGGFPFEGDDFAEILEAQLAERSSPLEQLAPPVPAGLASLVRACMSADPADRPDSAEHVAGRLRALAGRSDTRDPTVGAASRTFPRSAPRGTMTEAVPSFHRTEKRMRVLFLAIAVVVVGAILVMSTRSRESPHAGVPEIPDLAMTDLPLPELPGVERATTGADRVNIRLDGPALVPLDVAIGTSAAQTLVHSKIEQGALEVVIAGLAPGTSYLGELRMGDLQRSFEFETLRVHGSLRAPVLEEPGCIGRDPILIANGPLVAAMWVRNLPDGLRSLVYRESLDGGITWAKAEELGGRGAEAGIVALAPLAGGGVARSWTGKFRPPSPGWQGRVQLRSAPDTAWSSAIELEIDEGKFCLSASAAGNVHVLYGHGEKLFRAEFLSDSSPVTTALPGPSWPTGLGLLRLLEVTGGTMAMARAYGASDDERLFTCRLLEPRGGGWSPWQRLSSEEGEVKADFGGVRLGLATLVAYEQRTSVHVRASLDGGRSFSPPARIEGPGQIRSTPRLAVDGGRAYLAWTDLDIATLRGFLMVAGSADGKTWDMEARQLIDEPVLQGRELAFTVTPERFLFLWTANGADLRLVSIRRPGR